MVLAVPKCNHVWDLSLCGRARVWFNSRLGIVSNLLATHITVAAKQSFVSLEEARLLKPVFRQIREQEQRLAEQRRALQGKA
jgi:hypothetical protein